MADFPGVEIAVTVVFASIILSGILFGLGRAFQYKRIESFGIEELIQSIINAAIIGAFAAIIELVGSISSTIVTPLCQQGNIVSQLICVFESINIMLFSMFKELIQVHSIVGYYQTISLDFGAFSMSPLQNLSTIMDVLSSQLFVLNALIILVSLNTQIVIFIGQNALSLLFPIGLVLRTFFATRKVGGFLIALSLGLYIFFPTFVLIFPNPQDNANLSREIMANFSNNSFYSTPPILDLNDNYAIAAKFDILSGRCNFSNINSTNITNISLNLSPGCFEAYTMYNLSNTSQNTSLDFSSDLTLITNNNNTTIAKTLLYSVLAPIFSLIITVVFVKELASILGGEIGIKTFASI